MKTETHVSLDEAILLLHHWFSSRQSPEQDLMESIALAESQIHPLQAKAVRNFRTICGGSEVEVLFLLWCAAGALTVCRINEDGAPGLPIPWRGQAMLEYLDRVGLQNLYTPNFNINVMGDDDGNIDPVDNIEDVAAHAAAANAPTQSPFDPMTLTQLRSNFCNDEATRLWLSNAAHRPADWIKNARVGERNSYDPEIIARLMVERGKLSRDKANRILKRLLPTRSRHLEDYYD